LQVTFFLLCILTTFFNVFASSTKKSFRITDPFPHSIDDNKLQYLPLADTPGLTSLSRLYLHGNSVGPLTSSCLGRGLPQIPSLQLLWLHRCGISDSDLSLLGEGLKSLSHLHTLDLSVNCLTDACVPCLASFLPNLSALVSLRLTMLVFDAGFCRLPNLIFLLVSSLQSAAQSSHFESAWAFAELFSLYVHASRAQS
jgi:hypothetical protein